MPSQTNSYAFCADYSDMAACLFAIQAAQDSGAFAGDARLLELLRLFETDVLRKLYLRTIRILGYIDGVDEVIKTYVKGDFNEQEFHDADFFVGYLLYDYPGGTSMPGYLLGDFTDIDFSRLDFHVGFSDPRNTGYSGTFQTILNIFSELCRRSTEILNADKVALDATLMPVLDAFEDLQEYLNNKGLNLCGVPEATYRNNSSGVYLQAAGSNGSNGIAEGIHLRWTLTEELGDNHLPKGDYNNSTTQPTGFNKASDYVHISRIAYVNPVQVAVNFETDVPAIDFNRKRWTYAISQVVGTTKISNRIWLTFTDVALYNKLAVQLDPATHFFDFLKQYSGIIEVKLVNKDLFTAVFDFRKSSGTGQAILKLEATCKTNTQADTTGTVSIRKTQILNAETGAEVKMTAENIQSIRLKKTSSGYLQGLHVESYHDFLSTRVETDWLDVGNGFALSLNDPDVYDRLETPAYPIDNLWPQYNNGTRVKVANYQDKWITTRTNEPSVKASVQRYLMLSETDPRAMDLLKDESSDEEIPGLLFSYLDMISLQATDYHLARMLGLGHIDVLSSAAETEQFVYRLKYTNKKALTNPELIDYNYMSLPTSRADLRIPEKPEIRPLTYNFPDSGLSFMFDEHGYSSLDNTRVVNIGRKLFSDEIDGQDFFADLSISENSNLFENNRPVFYGIEYRHTNQTSYIKPEITNEKSLGTEYYAYDDDYPVSGILETIPVPDSADSLYIHFEKQLGIHYYAIYGIDWFSRASVLSDEAGTDETAFPLKNTLTPPTDVAVQYIQQEDPLLFTTNVEQSWITGRKHTFPGQDIGLTRVTFNWLDIQDVTGVLVNPGDILKMVKPDRVNAFFKPGLPIEITGKIRDIQPVSGYDTQLRLYITGYTQIDGSSVNPFVASEDFFRFQDSLLSTVDGQFRVIGMEAGINYPVIVIEKAYDVVNVTNENDPGYYGNNKVYISPEINSRFSIIENLSNSANWDSVAETVALISFADPNNPVIETLRDSEENITQYWIGGITAGAVVMPLFGDANDPEDLPGYYKISFNTGVALAPHPQINLPFDPAFPDKNSPTALRQAHVEWYKGWVRMSLPDENKDKKLLEVLRIDSNDPLVLYVYDPGYLNDSIEVSANISDSISVNFHPGYRTYIFPEPEPNHSFNWANILPIDDENSRKTLMGLQMADTRPGGSGFASDVSMPAILLARRIEEPLQFETPISPGLKVRPDATGKAAFTFDIRIAPLNGLARKPFGFMFYRTTLEDVLDALYLPATVTQIFTDLAAIEVDPFYNLRVYELVNLVFDPANPLHFKVFEAEPLPYGFPIPDLAGLVNTGDSNTIKKAKYQAAIQETLLPLTEQIPVNTFIKQGYQTENKLPVIRDIDGNLLNSTSADFDPFPMVRKYVKDGELTTTYIRFTDYFLNGSSRNLYFYAGAEVTSQLVTGPLSGFAGPVTVLHTLPSDVPVVRTFSISPATNGSEISVRFQLAPISVEEHISKIRIFRATDPLKAVMLQMMEHSFDVEIEEGTRSGYEIIDDFADFTVVPLGQTLYYRFAGIRTIVNEFEELEDVLSYGSEPIPVRLIDTVNPDAPQLSYDLDLNKLNWMPTTFNGTYYLYKQNIRGNWERIFTVSPPDTDEPMEYALPSPLVFQDDDGNRIYHRFKVQVQNSSGLFNLVENELTV